MTVTALLTIAQLLLVIGTLCPGGLAQEYSIKLTVYNSLSIKNSNQTYGTPIAYRGVLLGAMSRLKEKNNFKFTTKEDPNYGPLLVSVNGLAGKLEDHTYWEILSQAKDGTITRADVGVGCYIPRPDEHIVLKFTRW